MRLCTLITSFQPMTSLERLRKSLSDSICCVSRANRASRFRNQTNLALKGIIGIEAMSQIAELTSHADEASTDHNTATSYISQWQDLAVVPASGDTPAHTNLAYGDADSHGKIKDPLQPPSHQCKPSAGRRRQAPSPNHQDISGILAKYLQLVSETPPPCIAQERT